MSALAALIDCVDSGKAFVAEREFFLGLYNAIAGPLEEHLQNNERNANGDVPSDFVQ